MRKLIITLAAIAAVIGLASCEKEASKAIVGTWEATTVEMTMEGIKMEMDITEFGTAMEITFNDNGTGTIIEHGLHIFHGRKHPDNRSRGRCCRNSCHHRKKEHDDDHKRRDDGGARNEHNHSFCKEIRLSAC